MLYNIVVHFSSYSVVWRSSSLEAATRDIMVEDLGVEIISVFGGENLQELLQCCPCRSQCQLVEHHADRQWRQHHVLCNTTSFYISSSITQAATLMEKFMSYLLLMKSVLDLRDIDILLIHTI